MTTLNLTFDQPGAGIPAGIADRARTDLVSTGPGGGRAYEVQITIAGVATGATADIVLLDEPPGANPLLTQLSDEQWKLEFDAGCWGPFRVRCRAMLSGRVLESVTRRVSIRSPQLHMDYPALGERTDPSATAIATAPSTALTEMNEGGTNRPLVDFYRAVVEQLEANAGGGSAPVKRFVEVDWCLPGELPANYTVVTTPQLSLSASGSTPTMPAFDGAGSYSGVYMVGETILTAFDSAYIAVWRVARMNSATDWRLDLVEQTDALTSPDESDHSVEYRVQGGAAWGGRTFLSDSIWQAQLQNKPLGIHPRDADPLNGTTDSYGGYGGYTNQQLLVGKVNLVDQSEADSDMQFELVAPNFYRLVGERFAVKVAMSGGHVIQISPPDGQQIESTDGLLGSNISFVAGYGAYAEWVMDPIGKWRLVNYMQGSSGA